MSDQPPAHDTPPELPPRPRRRILAPLPLALLAVLVTATGFIAGVLVEKGQTSTSNGGEGSGRAFAARFPALSRGGGGGGSSSSAGGPAGSRPDALTGRGGSVTLGQVAYIVGPTLYVTTAEGVTVKVETTPASKVAKTISSSVKAIHPGETVAITGAAGKGATISAESIRVGPSGGTLASLLGGAAAATRPGGGASGGGEPALFGKGG